jgi:hypothetical protein
MSDYHKSCSVIHLNAGNIRRFRRVCEHIQSQVCSRRPPPSPRATRKFTTELSESSSCGSDTSEQLSPYPGTRQVITGFRHFWTLSNYTITFTKIIKPHVTQPPNKYRQFFILKR